MAEDSDVSKELEIVLPELESITNDEPASADARTMMGEGLSAEASSKLVVYDISIPLLLKNTPFNEFARNLLLAVMKAFRCEAGSILEMNHEKNTFFFRSCVGQISDQLPNFEVPTGVGIVGKVAETRQPLVVNDLGENEFHLKALSRSLGFEARNMIALPIFIRGRLFGVVELINRVGNTSESFTSTDLEAAKAVTQIVSQVIEIRMMLGYRARKEIEADGEIGKAA